MSKPKVALYWCASCGGCEETLVDLDDALLDVADLVDIVLWPVALDFKYSDVEKFENKEIDLCFINGAIRTSEQEEIVKLLREKSKLIFSFGSCASFGGIPALANLSNKENIFKTAYHDCPSVVNENGNEPRTKTVIDNHELELPSFYDTVYKLDDVIEVDYYIPGCPPTAKLFGDAFIAILENRLPEKGSVLAPNKSLCSSCTRNETKPNNISIDKIKRVSELKLDTDTCFLAQGVMCLGPATRDGCGQLCIDGNMPCTGCFGPVDIKLDQGAKMLATLGGILKGDNEEEINKALSDIKDLVGTFYKYTLSSSLLGSKRK